MPNHTQEAGGCDLHFLQLKAILITKRDDKYISFFKKYSLLLHTKHIYISI